MLASGLLQAILPHLLIMLLLGACSDSPAPPSERDVTASGLAGLDAAAELISVERITSGVAELADDGYRGRGPGTVEDRRAQAYIAGRLAALEIQPAAADGSWFQPFDLVSIEAAQPASWTFQLPDGARADLTQGTEYIVASGVQADRAEIADSELVFVGYGIEAPEFNWNDYKGVDLTGKTLVMLNNDPDWDDELFAGARRLYYGRWTYKFESAARQGAAGAIIIHTPESAGYPWQVVQTSWSGAQFELPDTGEPRVQVAAWMAEPSIRELLDKAGASLDELIESAR